MQVFIIKHHVVTWSHVTHIMYVPNLKYHAVKQLHVTHNADVHLNVLCNKTVTCDRHNTGVPPKYHAVTVTCDTHNAGVHLNAPCGETPM